MSKKVLIVFILSIILFPIFAANVSVGIPVWVSFDEKSNIPLSAMSEYFTIKLEPVSATRLDNSTPIDQIPMPANAQTRIPCPLGLGPQNKAGYSADDADNPFKITFTQDGIYKYKLSTVSNNSFRYTSDTVNWYVLITVNGSSVTVKCEMNDIVGDFSTEGFVFTQGVKQDGTEGNNGGGMEDVTGETILTVGGNTATESEWVDSAAVKSKFPIDFTRSFKTTGWIYVSDHPDGSVIGFVPDGTPQTGAEVLKWYYNGGLGVYPNRNGVFLEFDTWGNTETKDWLNKSVNLGDNGCSAQTPGRHIALMTTNDSGMPEGGSARLKTDDNINTYNMNLSDWPKDNDNRFTYEISYDATTKKLKFLLTNKAGTKTYSYTYNDPVSKFGKNYAYFVMAGNVRQGPNTQYSFGGKAGQTKISFQTFDYTDRGSNESTDNLFVMKYNGSLAKVLIFDGQNNSSLTNSLTVLKEYFVSIGSLVDYSQNSLVLMSDLLVNDYSLLVVAFPEDNETMIQAADKLMNYMNNGGCVLVCGETETQKTVISNLIKQMGMTLSLSEDSVASSKVADCFGTINQNAALVNGDASYPINKLFFYDTPSIVVGTGVNTADNTEIVASVDSLPVITDSKIANGYLTLLGDVNMWMGTSLSQNSIYEGNGNMAKQFIKNLVDRGRNNIQLVSSYYRINYVNMENVFFKPDTDENSLGNPNCYSADSKKIILKNPLKQGYEFVGWTGLEVSGLNKNVSIESGSTGNRVYTANWHKHEWNYSVEDSKLTAYCSGDDLYAGFCSYHGVQNSVELSFGIGFNKTVKTQIIPSTATNKNLVWMSLNPNVAIVNQFGTVESVGVGTTQIKVMSTDENNKSTSFEVTVVQE